MPTERAAPSRSHTTHASVVSSFWMRTTPDPYTRSGEPETSPLFWRCFDFVECGDQQLHSGALAGTRGEIVLFERIVGDVEEMIAGESPCCPERQPVARVERLADHRD